jgi:DNA polymerase I-like protein with 3'-5' exonuclease and polymerase domains
MDVEWTPDNLLCISLTDNHDKGYVYFFQNNIIPDELKALLENPKVKKVVANRPADEQKLLQYGCKVIGIINDVFLMGHIVDENIPKFSLNALVEEHLGIVNMKAAAQGKRHKLDELSPDQLVVYSGQDAALTHQLFEKLKSYILKDKKLLNYYQHFLQPISNLLPVLQQYGCHIEISKLKENEHKLQNMAQEKIDNALNLIPDTIKYKYRDNCSLTRNALLVDYLFTHSDGLRLKPQIFTEKTNTPAVSEAHLKQFKNKPFVKHLLDFKKIHKILNTYITPMYEYIANDGRVYPDLFLYRTVTGRTAMSNPPIQQIPQRGSAYVDLVRELFVADDNWSMVSVDLSQSELRIMAWLANEPNMLNAYNNGIDLHKLTASLVMNKPLTEIGKPERQAAKSINFGFIYGMAAKTFVTYAKETYGLSITQKEAETFRERYFDAYPNVLRYHHDVINFVRRNGYISSPLCRIRHLPEVNSNNPALQSSAFRQAINFRIQSFSSDLGLLGMYLFYQQYKDNPKLKDKVKLLWFIHDAICFQAHDDVLQEAVELAQVCLAEETKKYIKKYFNVDVAYPIESEAKIGKSWALLK